MANFQIFQIFIRVLLRKTILIQYAIVSIIIVFMKVSCQSFWRLNAVNILECYSGKIQKNPCQISHGYCIVINIYVLNDWWRFSRWILLFLIDIVITLWLLILLHDRDSNKSKPDDGHVNEVIVSHRPLCKRNNIFDIKFYDGKLRR